MSRRRALLRVAIAVLVLAIGVVSATFLVMDAALVRQAGRIEQPVRVSTGNYTLSRPQPKVAVVTVAFRAGGRTIRTRLSGTIAANAVLPSRLSLVYDARDPDRVLLAREYDDGSDAGTRAGVWIWGTVLLLDVAAAAVMIGIAVRRVLRRQAGRSTGTPVRTARPSRSPSDPDARR